MQVSGITFNDKTMTKILVFRGLLIHYVRYSIQICYCEEAKQIIKNNIAIRIQVVVLVNLYYYHIQDL